jgi:hypothetical protein
MADTRDQPVESNDGNNDHLIRSSDPQHPANLIPELCRKFYNWGWVTGTGGGVGSPADQILLEAASDRGKIGMLMMSVS